MKNDIFQELVFFRRRYEVLLAVLIVLLLTGTSKAAELSPFKDAAAVWHMDGAEAQLVIKGEVTIGVDPGESAREDSIRRGGDGKVAAFSGGHLVAGSGAAEPLKVSGDKMTFCIRMRDRTGKWDVPLFARDASDDEHGKLLYPAKLNTNLIGYPHSKRVKDGRGIEFLWRTTPLKERVRADYFNQTVTQQLKWQVDWEAKHAPDRKGDLLNGLLRLNMPVELFDEESWHDIVVRFDREKLELFVDGVLIDEEWPHGDLHRFEGPFLIGAGFDAGKLLSGFDGLVDHVALWDRALSDAEISMISGGSEEAARQDIEILGPKEKVGQYWKPRGYNTSVGDCMAFTHDGTFHVFFLSDRRYGGSKWGLQALPWGHISTKDFVNWTEHPCPLDITEPWECCLGTGSLAYHDGLFYMFYIKHDRRACFTDNPNFGDAVFVATSKDCIHFEKQFSPLFVPGHLATNDINPDIYRNKTDDSYILSLSNWKVLESKDLQSWKVRENLTTPQWWVCTSYFKWNDWYYFNSCAYTWMSDKPIEDPASKWDWAAVQGPADGIRVPKIDKFKGRFISAGFTPSPPDAYYGGELLVRELVQEPDGMLGSKWVKEMIPASGSAIKLEFDEVVGKASIDNGTVNVSSKGGFAAGSLSDIPQDVRVTLRVIPKAGVKNFGLCVRGQGDYKSGCELQFIPSKSHVQFAAVSDGGIAEVEGNWMSIAGVRAIDKEFTLDIIVKDDLVDACIGDKRTIITRNKTKLSGDKLFFFVDHGEVTFENVRVRPLLGD